MINLIHYPKVELCDECKRKLQKYIDAKQAREKRVNELLHKARDSYMSKADKKELYELLSD